MNDVSSDRDAAARAELAALRARLDEAEQTLQAIRAGDVDALIVGDSVYTLDSANAASNRLRSDVLAQMKDAVVAVDLDDRIVYLNAAAESQYGVAASDALGHPLASLYAVRWYAAADAATVDERLRAGGEWRGENVHVRTDGVELHVESTLTELRGRTGETTGRLIVSRDVSERYRAAAELQRAMRELERSQREFSTLVENSPFIFARFDRAHRHTYVSPVIERYTGQPPSAFIGRTHAESGMPARLAAEWDALLGRVFASGEVVTARFSFATPAGEERHFEARLLGERGTGGAIDSVLSIASDVTERELADRERRAAEDTLRESDRRKDVFLATLAHELRNPLAPIGNAIEIMRVAATAEMHTKARDMIERQLHQLVHLVDDLLDVSRISQGRIELRRGPVELALVVRNAVETSRPLIDAARHRLELDLAPGPPIVVDGDMTRLTQVVSNLLNNAARYTPSGGRITVQTRREGGSAVLAVSDTGIGIAADKLPSLFEMFAQVDSHSARSQGGLGIGLALVKRLVEMHGGSVAAASDGAGRGSRFELRLPEQATAAARGDAGAVDAAPMRGDGAHILIADDNRDNADSIAVLLGSLGYRTTVAYDGDEAMQAAAAFKPRTAILDLGMPRLSGEEVARRLRREEWGRAMTLIALSGWGQDEDRRRTAEAGFDHHLVKPLDLQVLSARLARAGSTP